MYIRILCGVVLCVALFSVPKIAASNEHDEAAFLLSEHPDLDEKTLRAFSEQFVTRLFQMGQFDELERVASHYTINNTRTPSGLNKYQLFFEGIKAAFYLKPSEEKNRPAAEELVQQWNAKFPNSTFAKVAHVQMILQHGWSIRGGGYAHEVKDENWEPFFEYVESAKQYMEQHNGTIQSDPHWEMLRLEIAKLQSLPQDEYALLADKALTAHPNYYQLYFEVASYQLPKWAGSAEALEAFANDAVRRTELEAGQALYARIYWAAAQFQYESQLLEHSSVQWSKMKTGIDDVLKQYPDLWNTYNFGMISCFAGDQAKAHELLKRIEDKVVPENWPNSNSLQQCRTFAGL
jgi:Domain of unknown function (DUF4034)